MIPTTLKDLPTHDEPPVFLKGFYLLLALIVTWITVVFDPTGMLFPFLVPLCTLFWLTKRRWIIAVAYCLFLPTTFVMGQAVMDYAHGAVRLRFSGLPGTEFFNVNQTYRCEHTTYGCLVSGGEWITQLPYNLTACGLIRTFGYMSGSYDGPYPDEQEAVSAVSNGIAIERKALEADSVTIGDEVTRLDKGTGRDYLRQSFDYFYESAEEPRPLVKGAIWQERCLILLVPTMPLYGNASAMVVVIDRQNGRPFAYYGVGDYYHRSPPVEWKSDVASIR